MTFKEIQDLLKFISKSELSEVRIKETDFEITVRNKNYVKGSSTPTVVPQAVHVPPPAATPTPAKQETPPSEAPKTESNESGDGNADLIPIKSPIVGTFYRSASPDKPAYISVGDTVDAGTVVCIVEAMKLFNEIESEVSGKIVKVLVEDASPVEYDQPLFLVDPKG